jgi:hypothetical protein
LPTAYGIFFGPAKGASLVEPIDGNQHRIFIDGEIAGTSLFEQGPNDPSETPLSIGGMVSDKNGTPFAGIIDEVRI